jgi:hypothetical protein
MKLPSIVFVQGWVICSASGALDFPKSMGCFCIELLLMPRLVKEGGDGEQEDGNGMSDEMNFGIGT